mgnify:FL=1
MVIASKGAPHIEGLENSALQVSAAFFDRAGPYAPHAGRPLIPVRRRRRQY